MGAMPDRTTTTILWVICIAATTAAIAGWDQYLRLRSQAVETGFAQYCQHNGGFAWKGECDE